MAKGMQKLDLAQRLTSALASENERWKESVAQMEIDRNLLTGDVLLASAFISYAGPFTKSFRDSLMRGFFEAQWKAFGGLAEGADSAYNLNLNLTPSSSRPHTSAAIFVA